MLLSARPRALSSCSLRGASASSARSHRCTEHAPVHGGMESVALESSIPRVSIASCAQARTGHRAR